MAKELAALMASTYEIPKEHLAYEPKGIPLSMFQAEVHADNLLNELIAESSATLL